MSFQGDSIFWVEVEKVVPNPFQPRREFDQERLRELADSIRMYGVLQPLTVTRKEVHGENGAFHTEYELIAGERRLRASQLAGVAQVPVIIRSGEQTEQEKLELAIIENLQREDLNAVDRALAFKQLSEAFDLSHSQVAKKVGRSREYVSNSIRLLALPEYILNGLKACDISEGHARTLLMLKDKPEEQEVLYREILLKKLSVREVERISRKIATDKVRKKEFTDADLHLIEIEKEFTDALGTRVQILKTDFGGKLTIDYFSENDLETLLGAMKKQNARIHAEALEMKPSSEEADNVNETVIREMDSVTAAAVTRLADATPLTVVDETSEPSPAMPEKEVEETPVNTDMEVSQSTMETPAPAESVVDKTEEAEETEEKVIEPAFSTPVTPVEVPAPAVDVSEEPVAEQVESGTVPEPVPTAPVETPAVETASAGPNAELRARLEAELARLEAEEQAVQKPAATPEANPAVPEQSAEEKLDDSSDDLYSMRNFSL